MESFQWSPSYWILVYTHIYIYKLNQSYWYIEPSYWIYWIFHWSQLLKWSEIHQVERNLLPIIWNLPATTSPPTVPPQKNYAMQTGSAVGSVSATRIWCCILGHLCGISAEGDDNGREGLRNEARVTERSSGESWRRKVFWCMYTIDDMFLCTSWTYDSISTGSRKHQVQLQNYQNLFHTQDSKLLHGTAFNLVFLLHRFIYQLQGRSMFDRTEKLRMSLPWFGKWIYLIWEDRRIQ